MKAVDGVDVGCGIGDGVDVVHLILKDVVALLGEVGNRWCGRE